MKQKRTKIQQIKRAIKIAIALFVLVLFIVLGFFAQYNRTFENSNMKKWSKLTDSQKISTLNSVKRHMPDKDLMLACMDKIAELPDSHEMMIRDAASLCYNGIKLNTQQDEE